MDWDSRKFSNYWEMRIALSEWRERNTPLWFWDIG